MSSYRKILKQVDIAVAPEVARDEALALRLVLKTRKGT